MVEVPRLAVFGYDFPHRKTCDGLIALRAAGFQIAIVLAAERVQLDHPPAVIRTGVRHTPALHPADVARALGLRYEVVRHDSAEAEELLRDVRPDVAVVTGARILPASIIQACGSGVLNLHPGLLPEVRGLDALLWAIHDDVPLGVTAHLIDERVDMGRIVRREPIAIYGDDHLFDLSERLYGSQISMLVPAIGAALAGELREVEATGKLNRSMPAPLQRQTLELVPAYISRHAGGTRPGA